MVYTDDWNGYNPLGRRDRGHATVNHNRGEFARDDDGDGVREVHCNTLEGIWTGLRNFLRPFRGVNKIYLEQYVIIFEWAYNLKTVTDEFLRVLLGCHADHRIGYMSQKQIKRGLGGSHYRFGGVADEQAEGAAYKIHRPGGAPGSAGGPRGQTLCRGVVQNESRLR